MKLWLGDETPFPEREYMEVAYKLSKEYKSLFEDVYNFARGLVKDTTSEMTHAQRRGRYWSALALIRCVMSSPAAAITTLSKKGIRESGMSGGEDSPVMDEDLMSSYVYDPAYKEQVVDAAPTVVVEQGQESYGDKEKRKLREFVKAAECLLFKKDSKLQACIDTVESLLKNGYNPIIWCRYIATANYVAEALKQKLEKKKGSQRLAGVPPVVATGVETRVIAITGELSEDEREIRLEELKSYPQRILVATDCLSEGVNLQTHFNAVLHYDLPWNPNRLEQRDWVYRRPISTKMVRTRNSQRVTKTSSTS